VPIALINHCLMESTMEIMQLLSEAHSLLRGLDVLTQTFPQPIYIPASGQVSISGTRMINGDDRSRFISVSGIVQKGKLNSIKLL